jgi:hypothetical protein
MNIETAIFKGVNRGDVKGWQAKTIVKMTDTRDLEITTWKGFNGTLDTRAAVFNLYNGGKTHAFGFGGNGDFSKRLIASKERCTEANVREQHNRALSQLESLLAEAFNHYELKKDAA